jgi:adenosylhomocysteine nucleosidase
MINPATLVLISANAEWRAVREILNPIKIQKSPFGESFVIDDLIWFQGGWGKVSAAATTQYAIDHFHPRLLVNLGTCGGFEGYVERGTVILVTKTIVYDIFEQMSDPNEAILHYSTDLDLSWLPNPLPCRVQPGLLVSADRDIIPGDIPNLVSRYRAVAADWESGAIAWVAKQNGVRCLILRGVTDLVGIGGGEAYDNIELFNKNTRSIMKTLINQLPVWLAAVVAK